MTPQAKRVIAMLRQDAQRDLYEATDALNNKRGSGEFYVSYSGGHSPMLTAQEVLELERARVIQRKWPDCPGFYKLA